MSNIRMIPLNEPILKKEYSYEELYKEYLPQLLQSFQRALGTRGVLLDLNNGKMAINMLAEEMAQETLMKVFEAWDAIQWPTVRTYISIIAWHLFVDYTRTSDCSIDSRKTDDDPIEYLDMVISGDLQGLVDPLTLLQNKRMLTKVLDAMEEMKETDQKIFTRIFFHGTPPQEVAEELGLEYSTLRKRLQRARNNLGKRDEYV